jgi:hypothetical protein
VWDALVRAAPKGEGRKAQDHQPQQHLNTCNAEAEATIWPNARRADALSSPEATLDRAVEEPERSLAPPRGTKLQTQLVDHEGAAQEPWWSTIREGQARGQRRGESPTCWAGGRWRACSGPGAPAQSTQHATFTHEGFMLLANSSYYHPYGHVWSLYVRGVGARAAPCCSGQARASGGPGTPAPPPAA